MKTIKRISAIVMAIVLICCSCAISASAASKKNYLLLGDSIAYGQGIVNSTDACYGRIVANTNGYNYSNDAISGITSTVLLSMLSDESVVADIKKADIISISIGGNDVLTKNWIWMLVKGMIFNNYSEVDDCAAELAVTFEKIISRIRSLNPHATILMQTIYNPHNDIFTHFFQEAIDRLNAVFKNYLKANPGAFVIADIESVISGHSEYVAVDTIHPNGAGNIAIAKYLLKLLKNLGLGTVTEPVIKVEPVDTTGFGLDYWSSVILYVLAFIERFVEII